FAPGGAGGGERGGERGAGKRQQRTQAEAFAGHRLHGTRRGQTGGAAAAGESHEHGLGDVVLVMTEAEQVDAAAAKFAVEERVAGDARSEEHTSELQSRENLVCRLLLEKKKTNQELALDV